MQAPDLCPRYIGHYVENIKGGTSPAWMRRRLALSGIRSISPAVDITNFVLLEIGQPMHAFDAADISGNKIVVRRAENGEKITTLDKKEFTLCTENLVICDGKKPVALAGIMGGLNSEIKPSTKDVFFEAAKFARDNVRRTSRSLGQSSDSSFRFEKGVDAYTSETGMARALHLIEELGCGTVTDISSDCCAADLTPRKMTASLKKINALLGIEVPAEEVKNILSRLHFKPSIEGDELKVEIPGYRDDVDGYPDLAEEIIRMYGYEHIVPTFLERASVTGGGLTDAQKRELRMKNVLCTQGFDEACTYSFYSPKDFDLLRLPEDAPERRAVRILNPIGEELSVMRTLLAPSMLQNAVRNIRRGNDEGKEFEIANVYLADTLPVTKQPEERKHLVLGLWGNKYDFFDLKGAAEAFAEAFGLRFTYERAQKPYLHPGISAKILSDGEEVGVIGELDPAIAQALGLDKKSVSRRTRSGAFGGQDGWRDKIRQSSEIPCRTARPRADCRRETHLRGSGGGVAPRVQVCDGGKIVRCLSRRTGARRQKEHGVHLDVHARGGCGKGVYARNARRVRQENSRGPQIPSGYRAALRREL